MNLIQITPDLHLELYQLDENGMHVLALVQTQPGHDPQRIWIPLAEVKLVIEALTEGALRLVDEDTGGLEL